MSCIWPFELEGRDESGIGVEQAATNVSGDETAPVENPDNGMYGARGRPKGSPCPGTPNI